MIVSITNTNILGLRFCYDAVKHFIFLLTSLVDIQVSFMIVCMTCQEYAFIPKLCAICLFNCMVESIYDGLLLIQVCIQC